MMSILCPYQIHVLSIFYPVYPISYLTIIYIYNYLQTESGGDNVFRKGTNVGQKAIAGSMTDIT